MKNRNMPEKEMVAMVLNRLSNHFHISREVWGTHFTGKKKRIDAIVKPIDNSGWKNPDVAFGIEFKKPSIEHDIRDVTGLIRQAYEYQYTKFDGFGTVPVLICPLLLHPTIETGQGYSFVRRLIGEFGLGEIKNDHRGLAIVFKADHTIWSEKQGISLGRTWAFEANY
ncbi:hypothetical protein GCM10027299_25330 [Larkinella ripae]